MCRRNHRRGVVLLITLSLLILFLLIGVTYLLTSSQFMRSAIVASKIEQNDDPAQRTLNFAILELLRGSNNPLSAISGHSILENLYGDASAYGTLQTYGDLPSTGGQLKLLTIGLNAARSPKITNNSLGLAGFFNGCVLTVVDGPAAGSSARIAGYMGDSKTFWILPLDTDIPVTPVAGNHVLINGRQFSGTGPGFNPATGICDQGLALYPNCATNANYLTQATQGGMNPDYTAADYNTMFLAWRPAALDSSVPSYRIIPSFHRPALINNLGATNADVLKRAMLRPSKADNPVFAATTNPTFSTATGVVNGPWDVDNDGDGIPDSIWVDPGFPLVSHKDGRLAKVLVSYLVLDMEGRININAHGNTTSAAGQGVGPSEINMSQALTAAGSIISARGSPTNSATSVPYSYKFFEYPNPDYATASAGGYRSFPPDLYGSGTVAVNTRGVPVFTGQSSNLAGNPYLVNLSPSIGRPSQGTNLFTAAEFEAFLRSYDIDSRALPTRLTNLLPPASTNSASEQNRFVAGMDGAEIPGAAALPNEDMRNKYGKNRWAMHIVDLLRAKLQANGITGAAANTQMQILLPPELVGGLKMNINRTDQGPVTNDDLLITNPKYYKQIEARHLYVLMMLLTDAGYMFPYGEQNLTDPQKQELTAQRLAQWSINVCCFKDPGVAMAPFEYMLNPFAGWSLDGNPATNEGGNRRLVWGCEAPDLLLMGGIAFHDRRVKDTAFDDGTSMGHTKPGTTLDDKMGTPPKPDPDMDQVRIPQGSAFIKLYCPANTPVSEAGNKMPQELYTNNALDLEKTTPDGLYPVWRLAISTSTKKDPPKTPPPAIGAANTSSDVLTRWNTRFSTTSFQPDRMSLLDANGTFGDIVNIERIVWFTPKTKINPTTNPDAAKIFYSQNSGGALLPPGYYALVGPRLKTWIGSKNDGTASTQTIDLDPASPTYPSLVTGGASTTPAGIQPPLTIVCAANPPSGATNPWSGANGPSVIGLNVSEPMPSSGKYYPQPKYQWPNSPYAYTDAYGKDNDNTAQYPDTPFDGDATKYAGPLNTPNKILATGTYLNFNTVFLQRLADPTAAYDKDSNPYITVDWMPLDLTVFNGENQSPNPTSPGKEDPDDPKPGSVNHVKFAERMRGLNTPKGTASKTDMFWNALSDDPADTASDGGSNNFAYKLVHSFAFLNTTFGTPGPNGDPLAPFPWLTWNNRPFVSPHELMMVPACSPGRLTSEFSLPTMQSAPAGGPYNPGNAAASYPFGHLLNFFQSNTKPGDNPAPAPANPTMEPGNFYRLFEFVGVPSQFVGTETWLNSNSLNLPYFRPPFNYVSNFHEPGKVNLNTVCSQSVLMAVFNGNLGPSWADFQTSRAGYAINTYASENNAASPTNFAGAFRSPVGADMVPNTALRREGVQATILRSGVSNPTIPLFSSPSTADATNTNRNPYFAFQTIDRLSNLVTTRSNVFAVWVTVGYFEMLPNNQIGAELGSDSGDIKRHRGFYLIDRTVPVGFERGQDYNVNRAILLQRYIE